jgi:hypothetical protein
MKPEPTDKLDTTTTGCGERTQGRSSQHWMDRRASRHRTLRACSSRMPGNWHVRFLGGQAQQWAWPTRRTHAIWLGGRISSAMQPSALAVSCDIFV